MLKDAIPNTTRDRISPRIAIVGGGPAGLSLAYMLKEKALANITVFESLPQVGGKSYTVQVGDNLVEMGTCYATFSHHVTNRWMRELNMPMKTLGEQRFEGANFMDYIRAGSGPNLAQQMLRYYKAKLRLERALSQRPIPQWAIEEAASPILDWLRHRDLGKIEHFMHRSTTNIAYGFVDRVSTLQALRWNDLNLIWTGLLKQLKMPVEGWAEFWRRIAEQLDVRVSTPIINIDRSGSRHKLTTAAGEEHHFDMVICAIPVDEFSKLTEPTQNEATVRDSVEWNGYTTTLFSATNWFTDVQVEAYKRAVVPGAKLGQLLSVRHDGHNVQLGGHLYLSGQLSGEFTSQELKELLTYHVAQRGAKITNIILQKMWKYHAQYKQEAIRNGLITRLEAMQGEQNTWYTGATFSHEAVSHIVNFNVQLAQKIHARSFAYQS